MLVARNVGIVVIVGKTSPNVVITTFVINVTTNETTNTTTNAITNDAIKVSNDMIIYSKKK